MILQEPHYGEPVSELWRHVAKLTKLVNALANAEVKGPALVGKVVSTEDHAKMVIESSKSITEP